MDSIHPSTLEYMPKFPRATWYKAHSWLIENVNETTGENDKQKKTNETKKNVRLCNGISRRWRSNRCTVAMRLGLCIEITLVLQSRQRNCQLANTHSRMSIRFSGLCGTWTRIKKIEHRLMITPMGIIIIRSQSENLFTYNTSQLLHRLCLLRSTQYTNE